MQKELIFGILAFLITAWGISIYWRGVVRREIIPHPFTFFIWVVVLGISSIELIMRQEVLGSLAIALSTLSAAGLVYI